MMPTPAPAGTTATTCFGSDRSMPGIQFAGYPASCSIHCRRLAVNRGPTPSGDAPGFSRPMTRSHAEIGCRSSVLPPAINGSCCSGIQTSGGLPRSVSPKNPGGAMPTTVNGRPSMTKDDPTTDGSAP